MLTEETWNKLVQGVRDGSYGLLLGAGFSMSSHSRDGRELPSAGVLAVELANHLGHEPPLAERYGIKGISQLAAQTPDLFRDFLVSRFTRCTPGTAPLALPEQRWRCIYTLNVDDVVENAYTAKRSAAQTLNVYTFRSNFERQIDPDNLQIVHLHGSAAHASDGFVFTPSEYGGNTANVSSWWRVATDELATQPFLVVGCSLLEEDLEHYFSLRMGAKETDQLYPSIFVTRKSDAVLRGQCERYGFALCEVAADAFFAELAERVAKAGGPRVRKLPAQITNSRNTRVFRRQWLQILRTELPIPVASVPPLLSGQEPKWSHLLSDQVVWRTDTERLVTRTSKWFDKPKLTLDLVCSAAGNGKTCSLMDAALKISETCNVFWFDGQERLDAAAACSYLAELAQPCVLMVDDLAAHVHQVNALLEELRKHQLACRIVGAYRQHSEQLVKGTLGRSHMESSELAPINSDESLRVIAGAREAGALGLAARLSDATLAGKIAGKPLLEGLLEVAAPEPLVRRLSHELSEFSTSTQQVYVTTAIVHSLGQGFKVSLAMRAAERGSSDVNRAVAEARGCILREYRQSEAILRTRHRVLAERLVDALPEATVFEAASRIAIALQPYANRKTIQQGLPESRLAAALFNYNDFVGRRMRGSALRFYDTIAKDWQWNSRYWEQRAICLVDLGDLDSARSCAETAVGIEPHPHSLTTLARVLFRVAEHGKYADETKTVDVALRYCTDAVHSGRGRVEIHPYDVGIRGASKFVEHASRTAIDLRGWPAWDVIRALRNGLEQKFITPMSRELCERADIAAARFGVKF
jgi:hypothetical protein